jgi:TolB protein
MPRNIHNKLLIAVTISISVALGGIPLAAGAAARPATSAAGQVSPRASVPWRRVGPGWVLAEYWPGRFGYISTAIAAPVTLYLISPPGHRYQLHQWAATKQPLYVIDWSGDKARVLLYDSIKGRLEQMTLATGRVTRISPPSGVNPYLMSYTRPTGQGLIAVRQISGHAQLVRLSLAGRLVKVLASGAHDSTAVYSSSGRTIAVSGAKGLQLVSPGGGVIRRLPVPGTGSSGCQPARWWNSRTILATCVASGTRRGRLWLVPASGTQPTPLTPQRGRHSPDHGDFGAWTASSALYLQGLGTNGRVRIFRQRANGALPVIEPPGSAYLNWIETAYRSRLLVNEVAPCRGTASLRWFNPATGLGQTLVKAPAGRAGVTSVFAYGPPIADFGVFVGCGAGSASRVLSSPGATGIAPGLLLLRR